MSYHYETYSEAPFVFDLAAKVEVHLYNEESISGPAESWGPAAVRSCHKAGPVEMTKVLVGRLAIG